MVYIIKCTETGRRKIGKGDYPACRFYEIRKISSTIIEMEMIAGGGYAEEKMLHQKFSAYRHHGEWFDIPEDKVPELIEEMERLGLRKNGKLPHESAKPLTDKQIKELYRELLQRAKDDRNQKEKRAKARAACTGAESDREEMDAISLAALSYVRPRR